MQQQLRETVMANRRKEETWLSGEAKWREKELEYQDLMRRSEKGIKRLEN